MSYQSARDSLGVLRACNERGVSFTYECDYPAHEVFELGRVGKLDGGTAAQNLRTVSKGSSRGAGPKVKQGRLHRTGGGATAVHMCKHGNKAVQCSSCPAWHCGCPGSPAHVCSEAA